MGRTVGFAHCRTAAAAVVGCSKPLRQVRRGEEMLTWMFGQDSYLLVQSSKLLLAFAKTPRDCPRHQEDTSFGTPWPLNNHLVFGTHTSKFIERS